MPSCVLEIEDGDWNLAAGALYLLGGPVDKPIGSLADIPGSKLQIDLRSLADLIERFTNEVMTYYPPGGWNAPDVYFEPTLTPAGKVAISADWLLDWDYNIDWSRTKQPDDYEPRRFELNLQVDFRG